MILKMNNRQKGVGKRGGGASENLTIWTVSRVFSTGVLNQV